MDDSETPPRVDEKESEGGVRGREGERAGETEPRRNNVRTLRDNGIETLFHFTDESNLESISKRGLLTWKKLGEQQVPARMNSSELSHHLDVKAGRLCEAFLLQKASDDVRSAAKETDLESRRALERCSLL